MKRLILCILLTFIICVTTGCNITTGTIKTNNIGSNSTENTEVSNIEKSALTPELSAPILKSITPIDITTFSIEWSEVNNADGYNVYYSENGNDFTLLTETTADEKTYIHDNLTIDIEYSYKIQAFNGDNYSDESNIVKQLCNNNLINFYTPYRSDEYVEYRGSDTFLMSGIHRNNSFTLSTKNTSKDLYANYNLEGKYKSIEFTYGFVDGAQCDDDIINVTLKILGDEKLIATYDVNSTQLAKTVKLDITNTDKLEFYVERKSTWWGEFGFADVKLYK